MSKREKMPSGEQNIEHPHNRLRQFMSENSDVTPSEWYAAALLMIARSCKATGMSHEEYCEEMDIMKAHYKKVWDQIE